MVFQETKKVLNFTQIYTFYYNRTLFRVPFRKTISELSNILYTKERSKEIFQMLFENAENLLMFTQNICKLEFYTLSDDSERMNLFFEIEKLSVKFIRNCILNDYNECPL